MGGERRLGCGSFETTAAPGLSVYGRPSSTHLVRMAIFSGANFSLGGIWRSSSFQEIALSSRLAAGFSSETAGPVSPPLRTPAREVSRSPPLIFDSPPWHL